MLKAALYLRRTWEGEERQLSRSEMRERKREIAERFGTEAPVVCNLATAGYFDEGGYIHELFEDLRSQDDTDERDFVELFDEIVNNQPFTVFVGGYDKVHAVREKVKHRMRQKKQYGVDFSFIDVRGIGEDNREKIRKVIEGLEEEADEFRSETISEQPDMVERIYLDDVEGLVDES